MLKTRVMPCLLLRGSGLVKTVRFKDPKYVGDPINTVRIFNEKEVDELIFLDITATPEGKGPPFHIISDLASECFMPLTYGGGVRDLDDIKKIFALGVEKIAINTHAVENPEFINRAAEVFGSQSILAAIDVKKTLLGKYRVCTNGARDVTKIDPVGHARNMAHAGAGEILLTSVDRDGTFAGYDLALIERVARAVTIPVIACGGAGKIEDFSLATRQAGASAVAAGSMVVYQGPHRAVLVNFPSKQDLKKVLD
ncbi:MAG: AglZ/HisF2 family acetamidino modification protein [Phycisphaerae bacterium]|nr:AglZ/HisF2 family acetamidino modification protein [Phycisphaerae bacterium]